jgi:hypothetical protein
MKQFSAEQLLVFHFPVVDFTLDWTHRFFESGCSKNTTVAVYFSVICMISPESQFEYENGDPSVHLKFPFPSKSLAPIQNWSQLETPAVSATIAKLFN